ncbi:hypothetical protein CWI42_051770 [Ordospora colligata]|uniref:Pyrimidine 5'-nucleotidase n=1 Tax=Ordospora colligata OC4 TaxID=1354746 RepID=A0A0B2UKD5_9MICR|nr:uncharacterized protein M896_051820 [Ordospora colligata OC4]KHN69773.1 hypothetical protein M896_051820 [Ordospora colligata OC4]TBU15576.1 hypothetical protein CWI41_051810 [Ordospora colligata]TBU15643.1 hypothetical protein CWI40_051790 [Ordospora colligata]TBU18694.1 hypothetical protein CWI42_051770 [Ordospora colligata]
MGVVGRITRAASKVIRNGVKKLKKGTRFIIKGRKGDVGECIYSGEYEECESKCGQQEVINDRVMHEDIPVEYEIMNARSFSMPVFIEMGQEVNSLGLKRIGGEVLFLYDIDDTLYHRSNGLQEEERMFLKQKYVSLKEGVTYDLFEKYMSMSYLYSHMFNEYGGISLEEYWKMLSEFDYLQYVSPDPSLRSFLLSMSNVRRCCFTNGPRDRAENILTKMGLLDCFEAVICIGKYDSTFCCKPKYVSYEFVMRVLGIDMPENIHFFDDSESNVNKAKEMGWNAWHINGEEHIIDVSLNALRAVHTSKNSLLDPQSIEDLCRLYSSSSMHKFDIS